MVEQYLCVVHIGRVQTLYKTIRDFGENCSCLSRLVVSDEGARQRYGEAQLQCQRSIAAGYRNSVVEIVFGSG